MKPSLLLLMIVWLHMGNSYSQQSRFNLIKSGQENGWGTIADIIQDPQGYIWLSTQLKGIQRYDGTNLLSFTNDPRNPNSISNNRVPCIQSDSSGIIWAGTFGGGLEKFDPVKNKFTHYRHDPKDQNSLANDTVFSLLVDHLGILWVGTWSGLDMLDQKTGKFIHYRSNPGDPSSLSYDRVWILYEDKKGTIWVGCGSAFMSPPEKKDDGGLNQFDRSTGKFTRFLHDSLDPNSIENNKVRAILEDSKGNLWVGTAGDGLHILDRNTKRFTHYHYDSKHPEQLSRPNVAPSGYQWMIFDFISFIREDSTGSIWIGSLGGGMNKYDPTSGKITHFGSYMTDNINFSAKDTSSGFSETSPWRALCTRDGMFWVTTTSGNLFNINPAKKEIPYYLLSKKEANSFHLDTETNELWIGTSKGLLLKNRVTGAEKQWIHDSQDPHSIGGDIITVLRKDKKDLLWIGTLGGGVAAFNPSTGLFETYVHDEKNKSSLASNNINALYHDRENNLWIGMDTALDRLNKSTGIITHILLDPDRKQNLFLSGNLSTNGVFSFAEDSQGYLWIGGVSLYRFDHTTGKFDNYLQNALIINLCVDTDGIVWAGTPEGLYRFDATQKKFSIFSDSVSHIPIDNIIHILCDNNNNLWVTTIDEIIRIDKKRDKIQKYGQQYGVHKNLFIAADNIRAANGELFFGDQEGYYDFFPEDINEFSQGPFITITGFKLGAHEMTHAEGKVLKNPLWQTNQIDLNYKQNVFSFDFFAFDYTNSDPKRYQFMLENYNKEWVDIGSEHKAYFFGVPPGKYVFHILAISKDGTRSEKSVKIIISPPWWRTWWAYTIFTLSFIGGVWAFINYRSSKLRSENRRLEARVAQRTEELSQSLQNLKSTQSLLIQSEKMASLGELTAGIAHEIQNPLNFVNNFSEVSTELLTELKDGLIQHLPTESKAAVDEIVQDLTLNLEKINHHGKRADAIVKGMLQHSRTGTGQKEPADLNALAAEWVRLSYQGFRNKDKSFQATIETNFDASVGKINIIPQDIGRVLLNLYNNAFYALAEKMKKMGSGYEPTLMVKTKKMGDRITIIITDNGNGISQKVLSKIFQPFFTTKPTGQGTGLGLSLAYDIVKSHGGELRAETKEGEGAEFIIELPIA